MTRATQKQATTSLKTNSMNVKIMLNINKASSKICKEICHKSQQLQLAEIRKMVSVDPAWNLFTCASQNTNEEMSKLVAVVAVKIIDIQTSTQLMKRQS